TLTARLLNAGNSLLPLVQHTARSSSTSRRPMPDAHTSPTRRASDLRPAMATCWKSMGLRPNQGQKRTYITGFGRGAQGWGLGARSEEHTSELQSRERSYAVFCL